MMQIQVWKRRNVLYPKLYHSALNGSIRDDKIDETLDNLHFHFLLQMIEFFSTLPHTDTDYKGLSPCFWRPTTD